jgi:hypothetical protein
VAQRSQRQLLPSHLTGRSRRSAARSVLRWEGQGAESGWFSVWGFLFLLPLQFRFHRHEPPRWV